MATSALLSRSNPPEDLALVVAAVRQSSSLLMHYFLGAHTDLGIETKQDESPVSRADRESSALLVQALTHLFPGVPVVSEEDELPDAATRATWSRCFLVDPLDGTKEFLRGSKDFAVNVALVENGTPVWGILACPALDLLVVGGPHLGAWISFPSSPPCQFPLLPSSEPLPILPAWQRLSPPKAAQSNELRAVLSQSHQHGSEQPALDRFGVQSVVRRGSSLKFLLIAQGQADVYFRHTPTWEWDTAAGHAILEGLECTVIDMQGQPLRYNRPNPLNGPFVACPRALQNTCLERVQKAFHTDPLATS